MESTGREKEKEKEKGRWTEENGGPVKCRWRVLGKGWGGCVTGALQFIFSIQRAPPPLLYCPSVWQLELAMWRGEQKRARCPAWVRGSIGRHPTFKKPSQPSSPREQNLKQNTLNLTQQFFFFQASQKLLNTWTCAWSLCNTEIIHAWF